MVIWARLFYGAGSLPLRSQSGEHYAAPKAGAPFYVSMEVRSHSETSLIDDIVYTTAGVNNRFNCALIVTSAPSTRVKIWPSASWAMMSAMRLVSEWERTSIET